MNWFRIPKENARQPRTGSYRDWKAVLAAEARYQCVYCAIHESAFGGSRNYHVEHYRPRRWFDHLRDTFQNLFYACAICNTFKGDDWPGEPTKTHGSVSYPDPALLDYANLFHVSKTTAVIEGRYRASRYMVEKLYLNRAQLIMERKEDSLGDRVQDLLGFIGGTSTDAAVLKSVARITGILLKLRKVRPYDEGDIVKPRKTRRRSPRNRFANRR